MVFNVNIAPVDQQLVNDSCVLGIVEGLERNVHRGEVFPECFAVGVGADSE